MYTGGKWIKTLITIAVFKRDLKSQHKQDGVPPTENQNTPFTPQLIDSELDIKPVGVTAERQVGWISKLLAIAVKFEFCCLLFIDEGKISS